MPLRPRNYDRVKHEALRRVIDDRFNQMHDDLEEAYYGPRDGNGRFVPGTGWRNGLSSPWLGFDVQVTPSLSKVLFDRLHGMLWQFYTLVFHEENLKQAEPFKSNEYDTYREQNDAGARIGPTLSRVGEMKTTIQARSVDDSTEFLALQTELKRLGFDVDPNA